ncbi:MAG: nucleoside transporter C-terminal domain-containing protein [Myxococcota bacterium]
MTDLSLRAVSLFGFACFVGVAWALSSHRREVAWRTVVWAIGLQWVLGLILLKTPVGAGFFAVMNAIVAALTAYTEAGARFVFGPLYDTGFSFALHVLPIIVFMGSGFAVLYHVGVLQRVVRVLAAGLSRTLRLSGAESLAAVANLFVGMTESALIVRPYLEGMTRSELFTLMSLGMATVAGSVMLAYVGMLGGGEYAGHLATASLISAPAGVLVAKLMVPETEVPKTWASDGGLPPSDSVNVVDAAAQGAIAGLRLAGYVGALVLAFVALIALANAGIGGVGAWFGQPDWTLEGLLGWALAPVAWLLGVPWSDAARVGSLLGVKTILNEFLAYQSLAGEIQAGSLSPRAAVIASYALCGFANFGSLAILLGGLGGLAPSRRGEVAALGLRSIVAGTLASLLTACVAGVLL